MKSSYNKAKKLSSLVLIGKVVNKFWVNKKKQKNNFIITSSFHSIKQFQYIHFLCEYKLYLANSWNPTSLSTEDILHVHTAVTEYAPSINDSHDYSFSSYIRLSDTYITEDGASISELSEERILCCWECVIVRLRFIFLIILLVSDLETRKIKKSLSDKG